jgi:hypothetical protein
LPHFRGNIFEEHGKSGHRIARSLEATAMSEAFVDRNLR